MKKIFVLISLIVIMASSCASSRQGMDIEPEPNVHVKVYPHYHYRYYTYYQPGYWKYENGQTTFVHGKRYKIKHY